MLKHCHRLLLPFLATVTLVFGSQHETPTKKYSYIPRSVFFADASRCAVRLSPNGTYISYLALHNGVLNIHIRSANAEDDRPVTFESKRNIPGYWWRYDEKGILFVGDSDGDENFHVRYLDLETLAVSDLTPYEGVRATVYGYNKEQPSKMLVGLNMRDGAYFDLYLLDLDTKEIALVEENQGFLYYLVDKHLQVRGACREHEDASQTVYKKTENGDYIPLIEWAAEDIMSSTPYKFSEEGGELFVLDTLDTNTAQLVAIDWENGARLPLFVDEEYDVTGVFFGPETDKIWAISTSKDEKCTTVFSEEYAGHLQALDPYFPGNGTISIVSMSNDNRYWVVAFRPEDASSFYYLYDTKTKKAKFLYTARPELNDYLFTRKEPITIMSRDGLKLHSYLTYPTNTQDKTNLPLVLLVHGGPWAADDKDFDGEVQFLANRGYAVLQVNYRGSTGYGKKFVEASAKEYGRKMQDDLTDAVHWAINQGIADPKRVAIMGASYGGYAALCGAAFTPELYCCAVDLCGPSNLRVCYYESGAAWRKSVLSTFRHFVGHEVHDAQMLRERSPYFKFIDESFTPTVPMLIVQGANDPRVVKEESDRIVEVLEKRGVPHKYVVFDDEGHGISYKANKMRYFAELEEFLARYLGGVYHIED